MKVVGFTGSREGMTQEQVAHFRWEFSKAINSIVFERFVHGGAEGSDEQAHREAVKFIRHRQVWILPGSDRRYVHWRDKCRDMGVTPPVLALPKLYLKRNRIIVDNSTMLIATPSQDHEILRSGTWATIRYARKKGIPIVIIYPDGSIVRENTDEVFA